MARDHPALRAGPLGATVHLRRWPVKCSQCTFRGSCTWPSGRTRSLAESVSTREPTPQRARWGLSGSVRGAAPQLKQMGNGLEALQRARWAQGCAGWGAAQQLHSVRPWRMRPSGGKFFEMARPAGQQTGNGLISPRVLETGLS